MIIRFENKPCIVVAKIINKSMQPNFAEEYFEVVKGNEICFLFKFQGSSKIERSQYEKQIKEHLKTKNSPKFKRVLV